MVWYGTIRNGVGVPDPGYTVPEGAEVWVTHLDGNDPPPDREKAIPEDRADEPFVRGPA